MFIMKLTFVLTVAISNFLLVACSSTRYDITAFESVLNGILPTATADPPKDGFPQLSDSLADDTTTTSRFTFSDDSSTTTSTSSSISTTPSSTRPQESGFWTGSDPFSFVRPTYTTTSTTTSSTDSALDESSIIAGPPEATTSSNSSTSVNASTTTNSSSSSDTDSTAVQTGLSTSISTHVTWVTASNTEPQSVSATTGQMLTPTSSAEGIKKLTIMENWMGIAILVMVQALLW